MRFCPDNPSAGIQENGMLLFPAEATTIRSASPFSSAGGKARHSSAALDSPAASSFNGCRVDSDRYEPSTPEENMKTAADIMTTNPVTVTRDTTLRDAARLLLDGHFNGLPVVEEGRLIGMLTQSDLISLDKKLETPGYFLLLGGAIPMQMPGKFSRELRRMAASTVGEVMSSEPHAITPDTSVEEIATLMVEQRYYTLPVEENGRIVGVVGMEDLLKRLAAEE